MDYRNFHLKRLMLTVERLEPELLATMPNGLSQEEGNDLLDVRLDVTYDRLDHDVHCVCRAKCLNTDTVILTMQLWNGSANYWVPQWLPWVSCRINPLELGTGLTAALKLTDSKWSSNDNGKACICVVEGIVETKGMHKYFFFQHSYEYGGTDRP